MDVDNTPESEFRGGECLMGVASAARLTMTMTTLIEDASDRVMGS